MWSNHSERKQWYVMRDLKRSNAKQPAYKLLGERQIEVFTPMRWRLVEKQGRKIREQVPLVQDMLFVHDERGNIDPLVEAIPTLQYRYMRGGYCEPMTVPTAEMKRFILAVSTSESPLYYLPEEITPEMHGRTIRIMGGPLHGLEGHLLTTRGSKTKRILIELSGFFSAGIEVCPEYIQLVK